MTPAQPILEADGLGKAFGDTTVLKSAGFSASSGKITALMGRNGAGKTTMLRIAVGLVRADYGRVLYRGRFVPRPSLSRLARSGLMYCQQSSSLTPLFRISDQFSAFMQIYGGHGRYPGIVEQLKLGNLLASRPRSLSGGERQRASLGLALLRRPDCLLLDEPFAGVAPIDVALVVNALLMLREEGTALVITGHDVRDILSVSDEIIWVASGTTHWLGSPDRARRHHQFRREYLGAAGDFTGPDSL